MKEETQSPAKEQKREIKKLKRREHAEKRERKMVGISLRGFVTVLIIVLCAGIMIIYSALSNRLYMQRYQDQLETNVISQTAYLKNNLEANHLSLSKPEKLELQIESMANALYGRILVIDRDYRIVKDTYGNEESAHIINSDVIAVMCGQTTDKMMKKNGYLQYMVPLRVDSKIQGVLLVQASTNSLEAVKRRVESRNGVVFALIMGLCVCAAWANGNVQPAVRWPGSTCTMPLAGRTSRLMLTE